MHRPLERKDQIVNVMKMIKEQAFRREYSSLSNKGKLIKPRVNHLIPVKYLCFKMALVSSNVLVPDNFIKIP